MDPKIKLITYQGVKMPNGWPNKIRAAQKRAEITIAGKAYTRIPYANPDYPCHDCCVLAGQLHVPGCDMERCPACGRQLISCSCQRSI